MNARTIPMNTTPPVRRGFGNLPCPCCGAQATVTVYMNDLASFHCTECDEDFDREQVEDFIRSWQRVLSWIDSAPSVEG